MPTTSSTGKDITVNLNIAGVRVDEYAATDFSEEPQYDSIDVKPLGVPWTEKDREFVGWSGSMTLVERDSRLQAFIDAYNLALAQRAPVEITITRTINYRDGSQDTKTYFEVFVDFSGSYTRGEANKITVNWMTGKDRL